MEGHIYPVRACILIGDTACSDAIIGKIAADVIMCIVVIGLP